LWRRWEVYGAAATQEALLSLLTPEEKAKLRFPREWSPPPPETSCSDDSEEGSANSTEMEENSSPPTAVTATEDQLRQLALLAAEKKEVGAQQGEMAGKPSALPGEDWNDLEDLLSPPAPGRAETMAAAAQSKRQKEPKEKAPVTAVIGSSGAATNPFGSSSCSERSGSDSGDVIDMDRL